MLLNIKIEFSGIRKTNFKKIGLLKSTILENFKIAFSNRRKLNFNIKFELMFINGIIPIVFEFKHELVFKRFIWYVLRL